MEGGGGGGGDNSGAYISVFIQWRVYTHLWPHYGGPGAAGERSFLTCTTAPRDACSAHG